MKLHLGKTNAAITQQSPLQPDYQWGLYIPIRAQPEPQKGRTPLAVYPQASLVKVLPPIKQPAINQENNILRAGLIVIYSFLVKQHMQEGTVKSWNVFQRRPANCGSAVWEWLAPACRYKAAKSTNHELSFWPNWETERPQVFLGNKSSDYWDYINSN